MEGCGKSTVGPSDEAPDAVANIGIAAHICAASPGGRRYDASMTPEQRAGIDNGIWTCADHGALIDRDDATYTVERLRAMKRAHEDRCAAEIGNASRSSFGTGELIALGPDLVFAGEMVGATEQSWRLRVDHFVIGDLATLIGYISEFSKAAPGDRYLLINSIGDGRVLNGAPTWAKDGGRYSIECPVQSRFPTIPAQQLPKDLALAGGDLYAENGDLATVAGLAALPQKVWMNLSHQQGESLFNPDFGTRIGEYYEVLGASPWFGQLLKLEAIRLAAIPHNDSLDNRQYTPFRCVQRVHAVDVRGEPMNNRLPIRVVFEVNGVGRWSHDLDIFLPPKSAGSSWRTPKRLGPACFPRPAVSALLSGLRDHPRVTNAPICAPGPSALSTSVVSAAPAGRTAATTSCLHHHPADRDRFHSARLDRTTVFRSSEPLK
ncbi:hypothetical protein DAA61_10575 [Bradyrhizobium sp. WBAH33]|nr:hypothetical protein DAA61_10575 [Bradyrhizobium sp. WBAH33]QCK03658.1 hypothetical protein DAB18_10610 [Bradyrhizobium sp. WBAH41]